MQIKIAFAAPKLPRTGAVAVGVMDGRKLSPSAEALDKAAGGTLSRAVKQGRFTGKKGQILDLVAPGDLSNSRVLLVGLGKTKDLKDVDLENLGGSVVARISASGPDEAAFPLLMARIWRTR